MLTRPSRPILTLREKCSVTLGPAVAPLVRRVRGSTCADGFAEPTESCADAVHGRHGEGGAGEDEGNQSDSMQLMVSSSCFRPETMLRRSGVVAFAHFVDERDGVLQQRDLGLEAVEQALLRRLARRLRLQRRPALADRLIDDRQVLLQRGRRVRIERALVGVGDLLEAGDRALIVLLGLEQIVLDRLRRLGAARRLPRALPLAVRAGRDEVEEPHADGRRDDDRGGDREPGKGRAASGTVPFSGAALASMLGPHARRRLHRPSAVVWRRIFRKSSTSWRHSSASRDVTLDDGSLARGRARRPRSR